MDIMNAFTLSEVAKRLPGRPSTCSLWRWCRKGHRGVKLSYTRLGKKILVTPEALVEFCRAVAELDQPLPETKPKSEYIPRTYKKQTPRKRTPEERAAAAAEARRRGGF